MLPWLAQTQTSDTGGWTITTFVALAGAIISLAAQIRLLAPSHTLERARTLRQAHADFLNAVEPELDEERMRHLRREVARAREAFIVSAKKAMSLPK